MNMNEKIIDQPFAKKNISSNFMIIGYRIRISIILEINKEKNI